MVTLVNLTPAKTHTLVTTKKVTNVHSLYFNKQLRKIIRHKLKEYTGFNTFPCIGLSSLDNVVSIQSSWDAITGLFDLKENNFILQLNLPDDLYVTLPLDTFLELNNNEVSEDYIITTLNDKLSFEHKYEDEIVFFPIILKRYLDSFLRVTDSWDSEIPKFSNSDISQESRYFQHPRVSHQHIESMLQYIKEQIDTYTEDDEILETLSSHLHDLTKFLEHPLPVYPEWVYELLEIIEDNDE